MLRFILRTFQVVFFSVLLLIFTILVCLTHPIFVLTTAASLAVTFTKLTYAVLKRRFTERGSTPEPLESSPLEQTRLPLQSRPSFTFPRNYQELRTLLHSPECNVPPAVLHNSSEE